jgi:hypothetical protein
MPSVLQPHILYVAEHYGAAAHLCACGCGSKIRTPLGPTEWSVQDTPTGPSLWPSVGNWQKPCKSHYVIERGQILWAAQWTEEQILAGRRQEQRRREAYYAELDRQRGGFFARLWHRLKSLF